jgi:DNA (cytosine-5)-methyltransferase 1
MAGFRVLGVDNRPQPRYCGDDFVQMDAFEFFECVQQGDFPQPAAWHCSPPCQAHLKGLTAVNRALGRTMDHPDLIAPTRDALIASGLHYVIENVEGAPLIDPIVLCGTMFPGLRVIRHRLFECSFPVAAPAHGRHPLVFTHDKRKAHYGRLDQDTAFVQVTGGGNATVANKAAAMGIDWMTGAELNEAIPPAYTEHIGHALAAHFMERAA